MPSKAQHPWPDPLAVFLVAASMFLSSGSTALAQDPLGSWNDGAARQEIIDFVAAVTDPDSGTYVPPADRIATFDNDGTLWAERPLYFQLAFIFERVRDLAPDHPDWSTTQPFQAILEDDQAYLAALTEEELMTVVVATHAGISPESLMAEAQLFLDTARHPRFGVGYTDLVYAPMLELLDFLRANEFRVFIVSGGGVDFIRTFSERVYGIPAENVIGSSLTYTFQETDHGSRVVRNPEIGSVNDRDGKPANIALHIGRRPVIAVGNSDGDLQMLQYATGGTGPALAVLVHHDDAAREYDYDHGTELALEVAAERDWVFVSIRDDFATVFDGEVQD